LIARHARATRKADIVLIDVFLMIMPPCLDPKSVKLWWIADNPFLSLRRLLFQSKHKQPAGTVFGQEHQSAWDLELSVATSHRYSRNTDRASPSFRRSQSLHRRRRIRCGTGL